MKLQAVLFAVAMVALGSVQVSGSESRERRERNTTRTEGRRPRGTTTRGYMLDAVSCNTLRDALALALPNLAAAIPEVCLLDFVEGVTSDTHGSQHTAASCNASALQQDCVCAEMTAGCF